MYFLQQWHEYEIKGTLFIDVLKTGSEIAFLAFSGTFLQSWLAQYAVLSKPNFAALGFWDSNTWKFFRLEVFSLSLKMAFIISGHFKYYEVNGKKYLLTFHKEAFQVHYPSTSSLMIFSYFFQRVAWQIKPMFQDRALDLRA